MSPPLFSAKFRPSWREFLCFLFGAGARAEIFPQKWEDFSRCQKHTKRLGKKVDFQANPHQSNSYSELCRMPQEFEAKRVVGRPLSNKWAIMVTGIIKGGGSSHQIPKWKSLCPFFRRWISQPLGKNTIMFQPSIHTFFRDKSLILSTIC